METYECERHQVVMLAEDAPFHFEAFHHSRLDGGENAMTDLPRYTMEELDALAESHHPCCIEVSRDCSCGTCDEPWPCTTARLIGMARELLTLTRKVHDYEQWSDLAAIPSEAHDEH